MKGNILNKTLYIPVKPKYKLNIVKRTVFDKPRFGAEAMFVKISKDVGVKIFHGKGEAKRSLNRQREAYRRGIAPRVLSRLKRIYLGNLIEYDKDNVLHTDRIDNADDVYGWGYKTEAVETPIRISRSKEGELGQKWGRFGNDLHLNNLGRTKDGRIVKIDFGDQST